jgi:uncharacterized membrane protein
MVGLAIPFAIVIFLIVRAARGNAVQRSWQSQAILFCFILFAVTTLFLSAAALIEVQAEAT